MRRVEASMPTKPMGQQERILRSVSVSSAGCWEWRLGKDRLGYGRLKVSCGSRSAFRFTSAHRYAWELWIGAIPEGINVLHRCDNRPCCNPQHLFLGTQKENMQDMHTKGRGPKGYRRDPMICASNAKKHTAIDAAIAKGRQS